MVQTKNQRSVHSRKVNKMANKYLLQEDAPISSEVWQLLNQTLIEVARAHLSARKVLPLKGPLGLGVKQITLSDEMVSDGIFVSKTLPLFFVHKTFSLPVRDLASYEREKVALDLSKFIEVVRDCCQVEDRIVFEGINSPGLLNMPGTLTCQMSEWKKVGQAAEDLIKAISTLDEAGFHGPYVVALPTNRYNLLFRRYESGNQTEYEHIKSFVKSIVKAPILKNEAIVFSDSSSYASLIIGQDMSIGFIGPKDEQLEFYVSESLALLVNVPEAFCVMRG